MTTIQKRMHNALAASIVLKVIILIFLLSLVGCGPQTDRDDKAPSADHFMVGGVSAYEFVTPSGVPCVAMYSGGVDCNFPEE